MTIYYTPPAFNAANMELGSLVTYRPPSFISANIDFLPVPPVLVFVPHWMLLPIFQGA